MSIMTRSIRCALIAAALAHGALPMSNSVAFAAAKAGKKAAAGAAAPASEEGSKAAAAEAAKRAYEGGVKAYTSGKYQNAVDQFNVAMRGGIGTQEMAKGLYYRGLSYKKLNKPGLAISDLTSALWLKNGLSDAERNTATAERAEAYKTAGVSDSTPATDATRAPQAASAPVPARATPAPVATAAPAADPVPVAAPIPAAPASTAQSAPPAGEGGFPQPLTMGAETAAPAAPRYARTDDKVTSGGAINQAAALEQPYSVSSSPAPASAPVATASIAPQPVFSAAPMDQPAVTTSSVASAGGGGSGISGFFSNIFGSSTSPTLAPAAVQTASTGPATAMPPVPQTSSWDSASLSQGAAKKTSKASAAQPVQAAAAPVAAVVPAAAPAAAKVKGGKFKVHIAAMRSREEADALARKLNAEQGKAFANRTASVDEAVIGSMGTFYRVRVGSYASPEEPRGLCNSLRNSGYDCLVVNN